MYCLFNMLVLGDGYIDQMRKLLRLVIPSASVRTTMLSFRGKAQQCIQLFPEISGHEKTYQLHLRLAFLIKKHCGDQLGCNGRNSWLPSSKLRWLAGKSQFLKEIHLQMVFFPLSCQRRLPQKPTVTRKSSGDKSVSPATLSSLVSGEQMGHHRDPIPILTQQILGKVWQVPKPELQAF